MGAGRIRTTRRMGSLCRFGLGIVVTLLLATAAPGWSFQASTQTSEPIKRIYVDVFQGKLGSARLRTKVVERLRADGKFALVNSAGDADAVVEGTGETWVKGRVSLNRHATPNMSETVYGGYLSLDVKGKSGETLWSYLVTPSRMHWNGVDQDMADRVVKLMEAALAEGIPQGTQAGAPGTQVTLAGAGATFPAPLYEDWITSFQKRRPEIRTTYQAVGSEEGIRLLKEGQVDFAASDVPLSDAQMEEMHVKFDHVATVLGGVVPAYNLGGLAQDLRFTPEVLAGIYLGKIRNWNDASLRTINRGARLPNEPIVVVHRSDGSGTSFTWTGFLSATNAEWKASVGSGLRVNWPVGEAVSGNDGVAVKVAETPGAIGYMELTYSIRHHLSFGLVQNAAGRFVQANLDTVSAAARSAPASGDLRASLVNAAGKDAYPITTFTWILFPASQENAQKKAALKDLVRWMLTSGQKECSGLGYLPLPREIADKELRQSGSFDGAAQMPQHGVWRDMGSGWIGGGLSRSSATTAHGD